MVNFKILLAICFCMLAVTTRVMAMKNAKLCIPDEEQMEEVYDKELKTTTTHGTITVTNEQAQKFPCMKTANTLQEVLDIFKTKVDTNRMKILLPVGERFYEYCTVISVEFANRKSGVESAEGYTADFKLTFTLEVDHSKWQSCIFANSYYGFRERCTKNIHITTTKEVMENLKSLLEGDTPTVIMEDVDANLKPVLAKLKIHGIESYVEKFVHEKTKQCNFKYMYLHNAN